MNIDRLLGSVGLASVACPGRSRGRRLTYRIRISLLLSDFQRCSGPTARACPMPAGKRRYSGGCGEVIRSRALGRSGSGRPLPVGYFDRSRIASMRAGQVRGNLPESI